MRATGRNEAAARLYRRIAANVEAMYADAISFGAFRAAQRALWDEVALAGLDRDVQALIRRAERGAPAEGAP